MRPNETAAGSFTWGRKQDRAAVLVALDDRTDVAIAAEVGVSKATLERWKQVEAFRQRVSEHRSAILAAVRAEGIAVVENRLRAQDQRWRELRQILSERAQDPRVQHVPGGTTGHIIPVAKLVKVYTDQPPGQKEKRPEGDGEDLDPADEIEVEEEDRDEVLYSAKRNQVVYEFVIDRAPLQEMRALEELAAKELGQHVHRAELTGKDGGPIEVSPALDLSLLSDEELLQLESLVTKAEQRRAESGDLPA